MNGLELDWMLTIDETGMPKAPTLKQENVAGRGGVEITSSMIEE